MDYSKYKGKVFDSSIKSEIILLNNDPVDISVLPSGGIITMDYRLDRVRVFVNNFEDMIIERIKVG